MPAPLTPHSPVGAWTSFSLGTAGLALQIESLDPQPNADLLLALQRDGTTNALPFVQNPAAYSTWNFLPPSALTRTLTPCVDEFSAAGITLRLFTPHAALPNPKRSGNLQYATAPGLLLELSIDNSASDSPATAFLGINSLTAGRLRPLDWSSKTLCGIASGSRWILATTPVKDEVFTLQSANLADFAPRIDPAAQIGGITIRIPPRATKTIALAFATYTQGLVTTGIDARYFYANYFPRVETAANFLLQNAQRVRESCGSFDTRTAATCTDPHLRTVFSHAIRAYEATTQVVDSATPTGPAAYFATISPSGPRNALDRAADHLPWELFRNPWVIRNLFDLATSAYAYRDKLFFPGDADSPTELRDGGMTFARDFGFASAYAPGAVAHQGGTGPARQAMSAFDGASANPGWAGGGGNLASEILLNAIYMLTSYALMADDTPWAKTRLPFARELLVSLENRDHWDPAQRTGILKAQSASATGPEQTVFSSLPNADPVLALARGNLYLAVKTFCANLLLTTYFQNNNDLHSADYSYAFAQKTAAALTAAFNPQTQSLPSNLLPSSSLITHPSSLVLAALEPLALPTYLGLTSTLPEYFPELFNALKSHALACLQPAPQGCLEAVTLRLASHSPQTHAAKIISILFVLDRLFQIPAPPGIWEALAQSAVHCDSQLITSALFIKPPVTAEKE